MEEVYTNETYLVTSPFDGVIKKFQEYRKSTFTGFCLMCCYSNDGYQKEKNKMKKLNNIYNTK